MSSASRARTAWTCALAIMDSCTPVGKYSPWRVTGVGFDGETVKAASDSSCSAALKCSELFMINASGVGWSAEGYALDEETSRYCVGQLTRYSE